MANKAARLRELYARIPTIPDCKGKCDASCGPVVQLGLMTPYEYSRIRDVPRIEHAEPTTCDLLTADGRCSAYELRPAICRLWGTVAGSRSLPPCPWGCTPERWLTDAEADEILAGIVALSGAERFAGGRDTEQVLIAIAEASRDRIARGKGGA